MIADLPAPRAHDASRVSSTELSPGGFFDDLPQPAPRKPNNFPAPQGFFDDLPQPALRKPDNLPAPQGFFDDLPQAKAQPSGGSERSASEGFFEAPAQGNLPTTDDDPELPAPQGFFDDLPGLPRISEPELPAPQGFFDDLPGRPNEPPAAAPLGGSLDDLPQPAGPLAQSSLAEDLGLEDGPEDGPEAIDPIAHAQSAESSFDDLDRSSPASAPVRFDPVRRAPTVRPPAGASDADQGLEFEEEPSGFAARSTPGAVAPHMPTVPPPSDAVATPRRGALGRRLVLGGLLGVAVLAGGGFVMYQRHVETVARDAAIAEQLDVARAAYAAPDPRHWQRAADAARRVVDLDDTNAEALKIGAEAQLASALDDGVNAPLKIAQAHAMLSAARRGKVPISELTRALALEALVARKPEAALAQLQPLATKAPQDPTIALYLGWALAAKGDDAAAEKAYDRAIVAPAVKLAGLYGRGRSRLALGDLEGAKADFNAVLQIATNHIGAQVGLAAARPPSAAQQRETALVEILARKDLASADPRAVAQAWALAGDAAMRAGRYDVARERFRKAGDLRPGDLAATTGLAETELRDGKLPAAAALTARALNASKDYFPAQLVQSEIEIKQHRLDYARQRLTALDRRATPLAPLERARLHLITGKLLEAEGKNDAAADAYVAGAAAARELDLEPMLAAVGKLAAMTKIAVAERNPARAAVLRARADELLGGFTDQARRDPQLALTLGISYLQAGNADRAEPWLRHAAEAMPLDAEARFQHGRALLRSGRPQDALEALKAAVRLDPSRADIAADLAHTYEVLGSDSEAGTLYERLLDGVDPSIELRARVGRFFARTGAIDKAAEQGRKILAVDPRHPAGLYLKGEGLFAAGKPLEAMPLFRRASEADRDPQNLDALGRAAEALAEAGDRGAQDLALQSYQAAAEAAPDMLDPLIGQGRIYVARREAAKAVPPLLAASRIDPKNSDIMLLIGAAYQDIEQPVVARQYLEAAVRIGPNPEAYWRLGQIERDANRGLKAVAALTTATLLATEAEQRTGKPVPWLTAALYLEGRTSLELRDEAGAREAWHQYVARNPPPSAQLTEVKQLLATSLRRSVRPE